jgi:predicted metal-dependent peptidase
MRDLPHEIVQARIRLMLTEPYLASAIARFPVINAHALAWCQTMATDGYGIYVNPEFCSTLSQEEIGFVFAHEVMHCLLGHIDRRRDRDPMVWNHAIDYATNLMLVEFGMVMPKHSGLFNKAFRGLTAEEIYDLLVEDGPSPPPLAGQGSQGGWDLHLSPDDPRSQSLSIPDFPSPEERRRLRITLSAAVVARLAGKKFSSVEAEISKAGGNHVPWRTVLARFLTGLRHDDYRFMPPNKKHLWRGLYLPTPGVPGPNHIVAAIDTSGSMSDGELAKILGELDSLRAVTHCRLTILQCDTEVRKVDEYDVWAPASFERYGINGRGGTLFQPVFDWIEDLARRSATYPDALVYLTDGLGPFPPKPPPYPVLWILNQDCLSAIPFGGVINLSGGPVSVG